MNLFFQFNEDGTIYACGTTPVGENPIEMFIEDWEDVFSNPLNYVIVDGVLVKDEAKQLEAIKKAKFEELDIDCTASIHAGFMYNGDYFQFNEKDQANITQQLSLLLLDPTLDSIVWKTENNGVKVFNREQFIEACKAGEVHKRNNISRYWTLKAYVETLSDVDVITNINFNTDISTNTSTKEVI